MLGRSRAVMSHPTRIRAAPSRSRITAPIVKEIGAFGRVPTSPPRINTESIVCVLHRKVTILILAGPLGAEPIDPSTQPHLKAWSNSIHDATKRFVVLADFENGAGPGRRAVLDRETGLVWEQSPQTTNHTWLDARFQCANKNIGGRKGWRLASFVELTSLV